ncbi:uncharacterized protein isoform X2 [Leptinotarsa decemlineata]
MVKSGAEQTFEFDVEIGNEAKKPKTQFSSTPESLSLYSTRVCRICANLQNLVPFEDESSLVLFQSLTDVNIFCDTRCLICSKCIEKLEKISEFISLLKKNDTILRQALINNEDFKIHLEDENTIIIVEKSGAESNETIKTEPLDIVENNFDPSTFMETDEIKPTIKVEKTEDDILQSEEVSCKPVDIESIKKEIKCEDFDIEEEDSDKLSFSHKRRNEIRCEVCRKKFKTLHSKNNHLSSHFGKNPVLCPKCGKFYIGKKEYLQHYRAHMLKEPRVRAKMSNEENFRWKLEQPHHQNLGENFRRGSFQILPRLAERPFLCDTCGETFTQKHILNRHRKSKCKGKPFSCDLCPRKFDLLEDLKAHKSLHIQKKLLACEICSKTFPLRGDLKQHMKCHTRKRPECEVCGKSFSHHNNLAWHMKSHTKEEKQCDICMKLFASNTSLERHKTIHSEEKSFICEICSKAFSRPCNLKTHLKTHEAVKTCRICSETFKTAESLRIHTREHKGLESLTCNVCLRVFSIKRHLIEHERKHTGEKPFKCNWCPKAFARKTYLTWHLKKHESNHPQCKVCFKYISEQRMTVHMLSHTGEKPQCELCSKTFVRNSELRVHMKKHRQEKAHKCEICGKAFIRNCDLVRHSKVHSR